MSCDSAEHVLKCDKLYDEEEPEKYNVYIYIQCVYINKRYTMHVYAKG